MDRERLIISERMNEVARMCDREDPIYEQITGFSIALYVFGYFQCLDLLDAENVDHVEAGSVLKEHFVKIKKEEVPSDYTIWESGERYLLVIGDPLFPTHFAVITDMKRLRPYFSKLNFFGSGFDSLEELNKEFSGKDGVCRDDYFYYKMKNSVEVKQKTTAKIYTIKNDGNCSVFEYESIAK